MAASAQLLLDALSSEPGDGPVEPDLFDGLSGPDCLDGSGSGSFIEPPLTSEPPLADAAPLISEVPISAELPLTSEPTAAGLGTESMEV
ncbi:hypothetical protein [Streptomyces benahoarensis]|uniref:Uncharacterized protein n=1 Tax=Streptomyces benahoarensis TaxID=2595054 RepID=A0A553ZMP5_9ACTN|nr:hypothetical protein [Streptomyces benahoarensis]TSB23139.1 hypothetical protein FNJ62_15545 [Streptomyces benahoarensis]TSB42754.1 hypothetical protein FNZ23_08170 [Streptomyces benahoarensis]